MRRLELIGLRRRDVVTVLGGAPLWPLFVGAESVPVVGVLHTIAYDPSAPAWVGFRQGLEQAGYADGRNVTVTYRSAAGARDQLRAAIDELASRKVNVIVTAGTGISVAAKGATSTIPVIFVGGSDPVRLGLVQSLNRPGGHMTGVTRQSHGLAAKQLELLAELVPKANVVAVMVNPTNPSAGGDVADLETAAQRMGRRVLILSAGTEQEVEAVVAAAAQEAGALVVGNDPSFLNWRDRIVAAAARHALPAVYSFRDFTQAGGLMSYDTSLGEAFRLAGIYTGRVLKGEAPGVLPVQQVTKIELVINLRSAAALGLTIPPTLLARADEVIE